ncbi:hypothetical protein I0P70_20330 [Pontibacter sp. FD36]|uniref:hypothetical protein n=1 Tax=Pontibacter sp. FD36 TaxID=2789860 RepID=UPI0018AC78F5|nr:hypothetical protein [Pontibacter sp. FD36]MBF8965610.1 hypothetical protein [Pontibacter sp. FD36]
MKKKDLERIKIKKRWPIRFSDFYKHYFFIIFPLGMFYVSFAALYSGIRNDVPDLKLASTGFIIISLGLLYFIVRRLIQNHTFKKYIIDGVTIEDIKDALKKTGFNNPKYYKRGYLQCTTNISAFSWGEVITIIPVQNYVLINSRPNGQPITIFKDKMNIKRFITELRNSTTNTTYSA